MNFSVKYAFEIVTFIAICAITTAQGTLGSSTVIISALCTFSQYNYLLLIIAPIHKVLYIGLLPTHVH